MIPGTDAVQPWTSLPMPSLLLHLGQTRRRSAGSVPWL